MEKIIRHLDEHRLFYFALVIFTFTIYYITVPVLLYTDLFIYISIANEKIFNGTDLSTTYGYYEWTKPAIAYSRYVIIYIYKLIYSIFPFSIFAVILPLYINYVAKFIIIYFFIKEISNKERALFVAIFTLLFLPYYELNIARTYLQNMYNSTFLIWGFLYLYVAHIKDYSKKHYMFIGMIFSIASLNHSSSMIIVFFAILIMTIKRVKNWQYVVLSLFIFEIFFNSIYLFDTGNFFQKYYLTLFPNHENIEKPQLELYYSFLQFKYNLFNPNSLIYVITIFSYAFLIRNYLKDKFIHYTLLISFTFLFIIVTAIVSKKILFEYRYLNSFSLFFIIGFSYCLYDFLHNKKKLKIFTIAYILMFLSYNIIYHTDHNHFANFLVKDTKKMNIDYQIATEKIRKIRFHLIGRNIDDHYVEQLEDNKNVIFISPNQLKEFIFATGYLLPKNLYLLPEETKLESKETSDCKIQLIYKKRKLDNLIKKLKRIIKKEKNEISGFEFLAKYNAVFYIPPGQKGRCEVGKYKFQNK